MDVHEGARRSNLPGLIPGINLDHIHGVITTRTTGDVLLGRAGNRG